MRHPGASLDTHAWTRGMEAPRPQPRRCHSRARCWTIFGKKVADVKGVKLLKKGITLKKLPTGTYKISIVATTVLKQHLSGSQNYKSCTKGSGTIGLKRVKKKHHHHG
jgi:hypothetical protein